MLAKAPEKKQADSLFHLVILKIVRIRRVDPMLVIIVEDKDEKLCRRFSVIPPVICLFRLREKENNNAINNVVVR